ncbi:hypothetical protein [Nocardia carnea]|uniref:hypothetical protein n=1 Tax=Nocardia carnea TaxID=37328 RepID=UPI0024559D7A|nr:hypothetical protein [Nocardia carnea]
MDDTSAAVGERCASCVPDNAKVNQLFAAFHLRGCDEETDAAAATAVGRKLGRTVTAREITQLRTGGTGESTDRELLAALFEHFCLPGTHLTSMADVEARAIDRTLRLLVSIRDLSPAALRL